MSFFRKASSRNMPINIKEPLKALCVDESGNLTSTELVHTYWWDDTINFGDLIGPWLISLMTNQSVLNSKYLNVNRTIFTVGSIVEHAKIFPNQKITIWGSGLIKPLDNPKAIKKLRNSKIDKILALRGELSKKELSKIYSIDKNLPLGDPALLLPRFFSPYLKNNNDVCVVPHFSHKSLFDTHRNTFNVINVMQSPQHVVSEIASSRVCISTSLHGIIIAQAYNIPWLLLRIEDQVLLGDMFKFNDFFSTLEGENFPIKSVLSSELPNLNFNKLANEAFQTSVKTNLDDLLAVFNLD